MAREGITVIRKDEDSSEFYLSVHYSQLATLLEIFADAGNDPEAITQYLLEGDATKNNRWEVTDSKTATDRMLNRIRSRNDIDMYRMMAEVDPDRR